MTRTQTGSASALLTQMKRCTVYDATMQDDDVLAEVRRRCREKDLHHPTERGFLQVLVAALIAGTVWINALERPVASGRRGGGRTGGGGNGDLPIPLKIRPGPKPTPVADLLVNVRNVLAQPVKEAKVTADALGSCTTDTNGVDDYRQVTPGTYKVTAEKAGHSMRRNRPLIADVLNGVAVPDGTKRSST